MRAGEQKPILHHPDVRRMLMDMKSRTEAMRTLAYYVAGGWTAPMRPIRRRAPPDISRESIC